ncbi:methyltransferase-like protein 22 isoform X1 [Halichondria panicea]|uniref:methyltransferase-like protein 22 isoform X1 n=1 Tax=Halichondria panicea TaxID=6063 RepID=UPI00312B825E
MASSVGDTFLSDVHVGTFGSLSNQGTLITRFIFHLQNNSSLDFFSDDQPTEDVDGDIEVARRSSLFENGVLSIEHAMSTTLPNVGLQVWRGALLMSDYLLAHSESVEGAIVLELGAGTGLVSLVAAIAAAQVFCTDTGKEVMEVCQRNVIRNSNEVTGNVLVREINWTQPFVSSLSDSTIPGWTENDLRQLSMADYIVATDVIYSDKLTDAFLSCLAQLHFKLNKTPTILLAFERRINFTIEDLAPVAPAYNHFMSCLETMYSTGNNGVAVSFKAEQLSTEFEQYFEYKRVKELEIWKLHMTEVQLDTVNKKSKPTCSKN